MFLGARAKGPFSVADLVEPALSFCLFVVITVTMVGSGLPVHGWLINIIICIGAGISAFKPLWGAVLLGGGLLLQGTVPQELIGPGFFGVGINVFAAVRVRYVRWPVLVVFLFLAVVITDILFAQPVMLDRIVIAVLSLILCVIAVGAGLLWRTMEERVAAEQGRRVHDLTQFRLEMARELHDTVAQTLSHLAMRSYISAEEPNLPDAVRRELREMASEAGSSAQELRSMLSLLRDSDPGLPQQEPALRIAVLPAFLEQQAVRLSGNGLRPELRYSCEGLDDMQATVLGKITVEAVNNMIKHAIPGTICTLAFWSTGQGHEARYENTTSSRRGRRRGLGLLGIRERAAALGGGVRYRRANGRWMLEVSLPPGYDARKRDAQVDGDTPFREKSQKGQEIITLG